MAIFKFRSETTRPDFYFLAAILLTLFALAWLVGHDEGRSRNTVTPAAATNRPV